jgi:hypothetical protein
MKKNDPVFVALTHYRNVGADPDTLRSDVKFRQRRPCTIKEVQAALKRLGREGKVVQVGEKWFLTPQGLKLAKGPATPPAWLPEDSSILMALFTCRGNQEGVELHDIIAAADYIDRSIPTLEQMHGALNRLASGGLLRKRRSGFVVTRKAVDLLAKVKAHCRKAVRSRLRGLQRMLVCPCCGIQLKRVRWKIVIDEVMMKDAYARYIEAFRG